MNDLIFMDILNIFEMAEVYQQEKLIDKSSSETLKKLYDHCNPEQREILRRDYSIEF